MAIIIIDAGPLIALAQIDSIHILNKLFGQVQIPETVLRECLAKEGADTQIIQKAIENNWLIVKNPEKQQTFPKMLGKGEIEAMQLALDTDHSLLIIDDQLARRHATRLKLNFIGTARLLSIAEQKAYIASAEDALLLMVQNGYRISPKFLRKK